MCLLGSVEDHTKVFAENESGQDANNCDMEMPSPPTRLARWPEGTLSEA